MSNLFKKVVSSVALLAMIFALVPTASFAATISEGDLVKASGSSAVYLIQDGKKRVFPHSSVYLSWGYPANYSTVKTVSADELSAYPDGDPVVYRDGFMFRFHGVGMVGGYDPSAVFFVSDGKIRPIESVTAYMKLFNGGVNESSAWDRVYWIPDDLLAKFTYPQGNLITASQIDAGQLPNGLVVRDSNSNYYVVKNGQLANITSDALAANRYTANANVFTKMLVTKLANSVLNLMPAGPAITGADTDLLTVKKISVQPSATSVVLTSDKTSVEADGASYATLTALVPSTVTAVNFVITSGSGMLSAYTVTPVNGVATVRVTPSASSVSGTLTVTASATGLTSASVTLTTVANTLAPQVVSVSNQGMRLINVVFDKAVDKTSAETVSNYTPKNNKGTSITVNNAKLLADGKTVQLYLAAGFYNDSLEDSIEIKNVQNVAQTATMSTVTKLLTVTDTSVPTVVAVEALGSRAIRVTFSEPVSGVATKDGQNVYAAFKMDDKTLDNDNITDTSSVLGNVTVSYPDANDYTKALITFGNGLTVGAHTLTVGSNNALTDYNVTTTGGTNAYTMQAAGYVATVLADTTVPTLSSVEVLTQTKVRYTFSKLVSTPAAAAFFYSTSSTATDGTPSSSVSKISDTVYEATWNSAIPTGNMYFYAGTRSNNVTDYSGNTISPLPSSRMVTVASDTAPAISSVSMDTDSDTKVIIMFSKDVDKSSAETSSNYVFKSSTGTVLTSTTGGSAIGSNGNPIPAPVKDPTNAKKVTITLTESLPGGSYQLCIANVKAASGSASSAMPVSCYSFTVIDKTRPTLYSVTNAFAANNVFIADADYANADGNGVSDKPGRIIVKYSEPMGASALDARNYKVLNVTGYTSTPTKLSDISGVTLSFRNSNKDVVIDFPNSIDLSNTTELTIGYIEGSTAYAPTDAAGNLFRNSGDNSIVVTGCINTVSPIVSAGLNINDNVNGLIALKIKSATTFEATFKRNIEAISASEFLIDNSAITTNNVQPTNAVICTAANYENRATTGCEEENESKVMFTIPSGTSYEFTATDTKATVSLKTQTSDLSTTKDTLGLVFQKAKTDNLAAITNDIKPTLKSFVVSSPSKLVLTFEGLIEATGYSNVINNDPNELALASDLIVSQTVGTTTTTLTGGDLGITIGSDSGSGTPSDSTTVYINLQNSKTLSLLDPVTIKTVPQDSIDAVGANGAKILANTTGITNASFVASSIAENVTSAAAVAASGASATAGDFTVVADVAGAAANGYTVTIVADNSLNATATVVSETVSAITIKIDGDSNPSTWTQLVTAANTGGIFGATLTAGANAGDTVVTADAQVVTLSGGKGAGYTVVANTSNALVITFNKSVDKTSLVTTGWATSDGGANYTVTIANSMLFDASTDKVTFNGINIGEFLFTDIEASIGTVVPALDADYTYNVANRTLSITINNSVANQTDDNATTVISAGNVTYTPSPNIKTESVGTLISTDFKPVVTLN